VDKLAPAYIYVDAYQNTFYSEIPDFELILDRKRTVAINWNSKAIQSESLGFLVEHSIDKQQEGEYLSELPYIPFKSQFEKEDKKASVVDNPKQGHWHYYRVIGLDPFGHASLKSEWKRIYVPLLVNAHVQIDTIIAQDSKRHIHVSASSLGDMHIDRWNLLRSEQKDSGFEVMETKPFSDSTDQFSIVGKSSGDHYYYKLQAINQDDTVTSLAYYFFTLDQIPPTPPSELNGTIDSSGIVQLFWVASTDDDVRGYKVYRANQKREEFIERTTRLSTRLSFVDTLALDNLTSEVYYYVKSIDLNYNVSVESDTLLLFKPDTIAPMPAALKSVGMKDESMLIRWANSDSKDLSHTCLIRNEVDTFLLALDQVEFIDSSLVAGNHYSYQLVCEDKSGNQSRSQVIGQYFETGYRMALEAFEVEANPEENYVSLSWNAPQDEVYAYQLFRAKNDGSLRLYKTLDPTHVEFIDTQLSIGTKYTYSIKYVNQNGIHSLPSVNQVIF
jgi:fibronectin type 3 domain-containing protein